MPCCETRMFYVMMLLQRGCSGLSSATRAFFKIFIVQQKNVTMCTLCTYSDIGFNVWSLFHCDAGVC